MLPVIVLNLAAAAATVTPSAGSLEFTGNTPTVSIASRTQYGSLLLSLSLNCTEATSTNTTVTPSAGSLTLTGNTVVLGRDYVVAPSAGSMALTGGTPVLGKDYVATPSVGALALSGGTPTLNVGFNIPTSAGSLAFTGNTPTLRWDYVAYPSAGSLSLAGGTPATTWTRGCRSFGPLILFGQNLDPDVGGNLTFVIPSTSSLSLTGGTPEVTQSGYEDVPSDWLTSGEATFIDSTGYKNAGVTQPVVFPTTASLTLSGGTPTIINSLLTLPTAGFLTLTGRTSTLDTAYGVTAGSLAISGNTPTITVTTPSVTPGAGSLTLTGGAPNASRGYYNTYGTLISGRAFVVKYADQYGSGSLISLPSALRIDVNRGSQGEGTLVSGSATVDAQTWEIVQDVEETWICQDGNSETWTTVTDTTEAWTNV